MPTKQRSGETRDASADLFKAPQLVNNEAEAGHVAGQNGHPIAQLQKALDSPAFTKSASETEESYVLDCKDIKTVKRSGKPAAAREGFYLRRAKGVWVEAKPEDALSPEITKLQRLFINADAVKAINSGRVLTQCLTRDPFLLTLDFCYDDNDDSDSGWNTGEKTSMYLGEITPKSVVVLDRSVTLPAPPAPIDRIIRFSQDEIVQIVFPAGSPIQSMQLPSTAVVKIVKRQ